MPLSRTAGSGDERGSAAPSLNRRAAFSFVEVLVAVVIVSVLFLAIYGAVANSVQITKLCQENERVTQLLAEKLDVIRLYDLDQLTNGFMPKTFTERFDPSDTNTVLYYTGAISVAQAPIAEKYKTNMVQITVDVKWTSGKRPQTRSMTTYASKYGLHSYIAQ